MFKSYFHGGFDVCSTMRRRSITDSSVKINISPEESQPLVIPEIPTLEDDYKGFTTAPSNKLVEINQKVIFYHILPLLNQIRYALLNKYIFF
jgi:hypothetical protein